MVPELHAIGKPLIILGLIVVTIGMLCMLSPRIPWIGRLPGDINIQRDGVSFYIPLTSCLLASVVVSVVLWIAGQFRR